MVKNINSRKFWVLVAGLAVTLVMLDSAGAVIVAVFADPAVNGTTPLFEVNLAADLITGGWADSQANLNLGIFGTIYYDAFFTMTDISYRRGALGGDTGGGTIKFFENGQSTSTTPLIQIDFDTAHVIPFGFGAMDQFFADDVVISGSQVNGALMNEIFLFSFANQQPMGGGWSNGYTATGAFMSLAKLPEPTMVGLLGMGALMTLPWKRRSV